MILKPQQDRRSTPGHGPDLTGSLVLAALLVTVVVSRVSAAHRVSDAEGALYSAGATWTISGEGGHYDEAQCLALPRRPSASHATHMNLRQRSNCIRRS